VFRFEEKSRRRVCFHHDGNIQVIEIDPELHLGKLALATGAILFALYETYVLVKILVHPGRFDSIVSFASFLPLFITILAVSIAKDAAFESLSREGVRVEPESNTLTITTRLWKFNQIEQFPIAEIRNLHSQHSNWLNDRDRKGVEFYRGKYGFRFALGASNEDRAKIVRLLESVGVSTLDQSVQSTSYSPSIQPR
jgi:hypothetical protein